MTLDEIRMEIDQIDSEMKPLFLKRMEWARQVAQAKAVTGGDVFVGEREQAIIRKRAGDVEEVHEEYAAFLRHLMSVSRRFQYGILMDMQDQVIREALEQAGLDGTREHSQVTVAFTCGKESGGLNLYLNMVSLNRIPLEQLRMDSQGGVQKVTMVLGGSLEHPDLRRLVCQMGKEAEGFRIVSLE